MPYQSNKPGAKRNVNVQIDPDILQIAKDLHLQIPVLLEEAIKEFAHIRDEDDVYWEEVRMMRKRASESYKKHLAQYEMKEEQRRQAEAELRQQETDKEDLLNIIINQCCPENAIDKSERGDLNLLNVFKDAIERNRFDKDKLHLHRRFIREKANDDSIPDAELNKLIEAALPSWEKMIKTKWQKKGGKGNKRTPKNHT